MNSRKDSHQPDAKLLTRRRLLLAAPGFSLLIAGAALGVREITSTHDSPGASGMGAGTPLALGEVAPGYPGSDADLETKFAFLSANGNSSCSQAFLNSIPTMGEERRLQGSCCSPMAMDGYREQIEALAQFSTIELVPPDPYDIPASLAKKLLEYGKTITPSAGEQAILDEAVEASDEKDYCCCPCWRWSVYEGLSKYLVRDEHFTAEQITDVLDNSDGCGGSALSYPNAASQISLPRKDNPI